MNLNTYPQIKRLFCSQKSVLNASCKDLIYKNKSDLDLI